MNKTVEHVLWSLETGCESVWLAIEGGGYDGEFSPDYSLNNCIEKDLISKKNAKVEIPQGNYTVLAKDGQADADGLGAFSGSMISAAPISATILAEN